VLEGFPETTSGKAVGGLHRRSNTDANCYGHSGSAARFFYCAKASGADRGNLPAEELPLFDESVPEFRNTHPTVKPVELMRYLVRLTKTPTGGTVLDPFAGSGSTGVACKAEGRPCILIEIEERYCEIAAERLRQGVLDLHD
jgi:site-specific DNA-methyltransferase (adenine-specific)